jgi:hypothetical protein
MAVIPMTPFLKIFSLCDRFEFQRTDGCQDGKLEVRRKIKKKQNALTR